MMRGPRPFPGRRLCLAGGAAALLAPAWGEAVRVVGAGDAADQRFDFPLRLLRLLLAAAELPDALAQVAGPDQRQTAEQLAAGALDIALLPTIGVRTPGLWPLRFPLRRGLLGARLLLARREQLPRLRTLRSLEQLKRQFVFGYGAAWHDLGQLRALGFQLRSYDQYPALFRALADGEIDLLSRGVNEIWGELDHPTLVPCNLAVVPGLALSYPLDDYFYVGAARRDWLPRLQAGMQSLWRSGAYQRLFFDSYGRALERAAFPTRRVFEVLGYGVEPGTPLRDFDALRLRPVSVRLRLPG